MRIYGERRARRCLRRSLSTFTLSLSLSLSMFKTAREIILDTFYFDRKRLATHSLLIAESSSFVRSQASSNRETPQKISRR